MPAKACWTCKDRKIRCHGGLPNCSNCMRSGRHCGGYGIRLSWPADGDRRRALTTGPGWYKNWVQGSGKVHIINVSLWDIEMHHRLTTDVVKDGTVTAPNPFTRIIPWNPHQLGGPENELVQYFSLVAGKSLAIFCQDTAAVESAIIRMALTENTPTSFAVLQSILAYARLHRDGCQGLPHRHMEIALRNLMPSAIGRMSKHQALQHITVVMIFSAGHILRDWVTNYQWLWYMCKAKDIATVMGLNSIHEESDFSIILKWLYYHDVLSRFSLRHRQLRVSTEVQYLKDFNQHPYFRSPFDLTIPNNSPHKILYLLLQIFAINPDPSDPSYHQDGYHNWIRDLKHNITNFPTKPLQAHENQAVLEDCTSQLLKLYKLSTSVILERQSTNFSGQSAAIDSWTNAAFHILRHFPSLGQPFLLFVFGCEARSDEQRSIILELIDRTELMKRSRNLQYIVHVIRSVWVQDDLADGIIDYGKKLGNIFGAMDIVPSFA